MKIERNKPCPCGSGLKFKKCCGNKPLAKEAQIKISIDSILSAVKFGLENGNIFSTDAHKVEVRTASIANGGDTICLEFYAKHSKSLDVKLEIAYIMSFLYSFLKDEAYKDIPIKFFGVKAFDQNNVEIMYAVNNKNAASLITSEGSIQWFNKTLFQENTADYRLSRAKTMISDIENGLRKVIKNIYEKKNGFGWWDKSLEPKLNSAIKGTYKNQFGLEISDGSILINYTFTLDLKKIISSDWGAFRHLFKSKTAFENEMVELNTIRREEAHNRDIKEAHLNNLEKIYYSLLGEIANIYPDVSVNYLVENWRTKIKLAMVNPVSCTYTMADFNTEDLEGKRRLIIADCNAQISYIDNVLTKLNSLDPPVSKRKSHEEMVSLLDGMLKLQQQKLRRTENLDFDDYQQLIDAIEQHKIKMEIFSLEFLIQES